MQVNFNMQNMANSNRSNIKANNHPNFGAKIKQGSLAKTVGVLHDAFGGENIPLFLERFKSLQKEIKELKINGEDPTLSFYAKVKRIDTPVRSYNELYTKVVAKLNGEVEKVVVEHSDPYVGNAASTVIDIELPKLADSLVVQAKSTVGKLAKCKSFMKKKAFQIEKSINE